MGHESTLPCFKEEKGFEGQKDWDIGCLKELHQVCIFQAIHFQVHIFNNELKHQMYVSIQQILEVASAFFT